MPETPNRKYVYPVQADPAQVPNHIRQPLEQVDADVQGLIDQVGQKVTGLGANGLWIGTQDEYDKIVPDPKTVYVIADATEAPPVLAQELGTPRTTSLATTTASSIVPELPTLTDHWGYLAIIVGQNPIANGVWTAPTGWLKMADQSDVDGGFSSRPMAIFSAPAGTSTIAFASPGGGAQRYVAAVYPVLKQPILRGIAAATNTGIDAMVGPAMIYSAPSLTVTIGTSNYGSVSGASLPSMTLAQVNAGSGPAVVSGTGSATILHIHKDSGLGMAAPSRGYSLSMPMASSMHGWRVGIGYQ